jgi:hypothetical protein
MANREFWRRKRTISLPVEDDQLLESFIERVEKECGVIRTNPSHVFRVGLKVLSKLSNGELKKAFDALPPTRYGKEPTKPRKTLSDEELREMLKEMGLG